jgi:hypothetical protein
VSETLSIEVLADTCDLFYQQRYRSGIEMVAFTPLISEANKGQWQQYAFFRQGWVEESRAIVASAQGELEDESALVGIDALKTNITPMIWQRDSDYIPIPALGPAPYAPFWQTSPPPFNPGLINYNMFAESFSARMNQVVEVVKGERGNSTENRYSELWSPLLTCLSLTSNPRGGPFGGWQFWQTLWKRGESPRAQRLS